MYFAGKAITIEQLLEQLRHYHQLSTIAQEAVMAAVEQQVFAKGTHLLTEGKTCRHIYFLQQGAVRGYYNLDGKEITHWFAFEHDFLTSFHSFSTQQPSVENIQFMEGSIAWAISKEKLEALMLAHHDIEKLVRIVYEKYYIRLEERFVNAQFRSATERYQDMLVQAPHMISRVPLGYIASYLGISQETLSRIRNKL